MLGHVSDPVRAQQLIAEQPDMRALPDILGCVTVSHDEGKWTMIIYFKSEAEAREGEAKEMPPQALNAMEELQ
jgi:hypothetical protein